MTKQELIAHFQEQKKIIEREIVFWQAQLDAEAEKPELRHGDFGYDHDGDACLNLYARDSGTFRQAGKTYLYEEEIHTKAFQITTVLGNIFDLLKKDEFIEMIAMLKRRENKNV